jgi:hypothetical protein
LKKLSAEELVFLSNNLNSGTKNNSLIIQKIFDKIKVDREDLTEYEKTEINERALILASKCEQKEHILNQTGDLRIVENFDSTCKSKSYVN